MSINVVPEHALPKSFFFEEELTSSRHREASESARTRLAELSGLSPAYGSGRSSPARSEPHPHVEHTQASRAMADQVASYPAAAK